MPVPPLCMNIVKSGQKDFRMQTQAKPKTFIQHKSLTDTPKNEEKLSGWGNYPIGESRVITPRNQDEMIGILKEGNVLARGLCRSYGAPPLTNDPCIAPSTQL